VEDVAASRRYMKFCREASPLLPFAGLQEGNEGGRDEDDEGLGRSGSETEGEREATAGADMDDMLDTDGHDSMTTERAFDFGFDVSAPSHSQSPASRSLTKQQTPISPRTNSPLRQAFPAPTPSPPRTNSRGRVSTVWDDGEGYWAEEESRTASPVYSTSDAHAPAQVLSTASVAQTPRQRKEWQDVTWATPADRLGKTMGLADKRTAPHGISEVEVADSEDISPSKSENGAWSVGRRRRMEEMQWQRQRPQQSPIAAATPRSLYDAEGFLRAGTV